MAEMPTFLAKLKAKKHLFVQKNLEPEPQKEQQQRFVGQAGQQNKNPRFKQGAQAGSPKSKFCQFYNTDKGCKNAGKPYCVVGVHKCNRRLADKSFCPGTHTAKEHDAAYKVKKETTAAAAANPPLPPGDPPS